MPERYYSDGGLINSLEQTKERAMSDKKTETPKQESKSSVPDARTKSTKKGDIELSEEALARASGGIQWSGSGGSGDAPMESITKPK
jgi:hypothetical protein